MSRPNYCPAPAPAFRHRAGSAAVNRLYGRLVLAHEAGAIDDYAYEAATETDKRLVWRVWPAGAGRRNPSEAGPYGAGALEYAAGELAAVGRFLDSVLAAAGVVSIERGPSWCGYRGIVVTFTNGRTVAQSAETTAAGVRIVTREAGRPEAAAAS